jgi:hypothetical protein
MRRPCGRRTCCWLLKIKDIRFARLGPSSATHIGELRLPPTWMDGQPMRESLATQVTARFAR